MTKPKKPKKKKKSVSKQKKSISTDSFCFGNLRGCEEYIRERYSPPTRPLYRWVKSPVTSRDFIPQSFLREDYNDNFEDLDIDFTIEERVERSTTSMYISEEASITEYQKIIERLHKKDIKENNPPEQGHKSQFINRCGQYVAKFNLTEKDALVGEVNKRGHVNVLLKDGFDFRQCQDTNFGLKNMLDNDE